MPSLTNVKLSLQSQAAFNLFAEHSDKAIPNEFDWGHFYDFIYKTHSLHIKLGSEDITDLLIDTGFSEVCASHLADVYMHGR